jgi:hypothetical protein
MEIKFYTENADYPVGGCCAIACLRNFPIDPQFKSGYKKEEDISKQIITDCAHALKKAKSIVFASVTTQQKVAEKLLIEAGFVTSQEDWAYRDPIASGNYTIGVKTYTKLLYTPPVKQAANV